MNLPSLVGGQLSYSGKVKVYADPRMPWTLDGEKADGYCDVTVENLHHAIRIVKRVESK